MLKCCNKHINITAKHNMNEAITKSIKLIHLQCRVNTMDTITVIRLYIQFHPLNLSNKLLKQSKGNNFKQISRI